MQDHIVKAVTADGNLRVVAALTTATVQQARERHDLYPVPTAALGRLLTGGLLMAADFKGDERVNLRIDGDGPIGQLLVDAGNGQARGYVANPQVALGLNTMGKLDVGGAVGKGTLTVIKDLGLKEPWTGSVDLVSGEIAEDLTHYFIHSEQIPSAVALGVLVTPEAKVAVAGGFIVQVMPDCPEEVLSQVETRIGQVGRVTNLLQEKDPESIIRWMLEGADPQIFDPIPVGYKCRCSRERMVRALISLGKDELEQLKARPEGFETICHFCNEKYQFSREDIDDILAHL